MSESLRVVVGTDTLFDYPDKRPDQMLVHEWKALDDVSCATHVPHWRGLTDASVPKIAYEFVELLNLAPRPTQETGSSHAA